MLAAAGRFLAPVGVLTAVLVYFGQVREKAVFGHFGIDLGTVGFSTTDYVVRTAGTLLGPLATLLGIALAAVVANHGLEWWLARSDVAVRRRIVIGVGASAFVALLIGLQGVYRRGDPLLDPVVAPIALGTGALLLEYMFHLPRPPDAASDPDPPATRDMNLLRQAIVVALVLTALFWVTAITAQQWGDRVARTIELSLPLQPQAVVYSQKLLQIGGHGIEAEPLDDRGAAYAVRYKGLRLLAHSGGNWLLLPVGWTSDSGDTVIILSDAMSGTRVELGP